MHLWTVVTAVIIAALIIFIGADKKLRPLKRQLFLSVLGPVEIIFLSFLFFNSHNTIKYKLCFDVSLILIIVSIVLYFSCRHISRPKHTGWAVVILLSVVGSVVNYMLTGTSPANNIPAYDTGVSPIVRGVAIVCSWYMAMMIPEIGFRSAELSDKKAENNNQNKK